MLSDGSIDPVSLGIDPESLSGELDSIEFTDWEYTTIAPDRGVISDWDLETW